MKKGRYKKASVYYEKGEIEKALKECELAIAENLKDSAILNLKGIILYQKGLLNEAITCWNINREFNDDSLAKSYIKDVQSDKKLEELYYEGEALLNNLNVDEALGKFKLCQESDFNSIKVNTAIAICYFKKGQFEESRFYIIKALKIDKNFISAKKLSKELDGISGEGKVNSKSIVAIVLLLSMIAGGVYYFSTNIIEGGNKSNELSSVDTDNSEKKEDTKGETREEIDFSTLEAAIRDKDVDKLYVLLKSVDKDKLSKDNIEKVNKAEILIKDFGVEKFYNLAQEYVKKEDNLNAYNELKKAYEYGSESYLYQHIVYFRGFIAKELNEVDEAIKYYEEYIKLYDKQGYTEEVLYNLVVLNKDINKSKSKEYAKKLVKDYPKSMYNNKVVQGIINGE